MVNDSIEKQRGSTARAGQAEAQARNHEEDQAREEGETGQEGGQQAERRPRQQEDRGDRHD